MVKAILCDIDGTLVESNWLHASAWKDAFAAMNIELELEDLRRQIGKGGDQLVPVFVPWWKRQVVQEPLEAYRKFVFQTDYMPQVRPFPHVRDLFLHIREHGIRIALASSAGQQDLEAYKKLANVEDLIDASTSADDARRSKPHPDIFSATLEKLSLDAKDTLALGDTPYDAESAGKAGVFTVGVMTGGWSEQDLLSAGCIEVYRDLGDLLSRFDQSAFARWH